MIAFLVVALVGGAVFYALIAAKSPSSRGKSRHYKSGPTVNLADIRGRWDTIKSSADAGPAGLKNAINDADKLFDAAMAAQGLRGDTMAERLKAARPRFHDYSTYDAVWRAHKLRNAMAHDIGFDLVQSQAREALADFERGLRELGAL